MRLMELRSQQSNFLTQVFQIMFWRFDLTGLVEGQQEFLPEEFMGLSFQLYLSILVSVACLDFFSPSFFLVPTQGMFSSTYFLNLLLILIEIRSDEIFVWYLGTRNLTSLHCSVPLKSQKGSFLGGVRGSHACYFILTITRRMYS